MPASSDRPWLELNDRYHLTPGLGFQLSLDKTIDFRCTSSRFTNADERDGFATNGCASVPVGPLTDPHRPGIEFLSVPSQLGDAASSPRSVTLPQLQASRTLSIGVTVGILHTLRPSFSYKGLAPYKSTVMPGVPTVGSDRLAPRSFDRDGSRDTRAGVERLVQWTADRSSPR